MVSVSKEDKEKLKSVSAEYFYVSKTFEGRKVSHGMTEVVSCFPLIRTQIRSDIARF